MKTQNIPMFDFRCFSFSLVQLRRISSRRVVVISRSSSSCERSESRLEKKEESGNCRDTNASWKRTDDEDCRDEKFLGVRTSSEFII